MAGKLDSDDARRRNDRPEDPSTRLDSDSDRRRSNGSVWRDGVPYDIWWCSGGVDPTGSSHADSDLQVERFERELDRG